MRGGVVYGWSFSAELACCLMGFLESYRRLPRYQRVLLGLVGIGVGWYGPTIMSYLLNVQPQHQSPNDKDNRT